MNDEIVERIADYAWGYYGWPHAIPYPVFNASIGSFVSNTNEVFAYWDEAKAEVVFSLGDLDTIRKPLSYFMSDEVNSGADVRTKALEYDTSMDPISPDFDPNSWDYKTDSIIHANLSGMTKDPRAIMEMFLDITKEIMIGDIIVVDQHRCDIHDTQAQLASQFMHAYNIDSMQCIVYSGMQITFRKVSE